MFNLHQPKILRTHYARVAAASSSYFETEPSSHGTIEDTYRFQADSQETLGTDRLVSCMAYIFLITGLHFVVICGSCAEHGDMQQSIPH